MRRQKTALSNYVVKANDIVRTRYDLTLEQQKCLLFIISKVKPSDDISGWYEFTLTELCDSLNINLDGGGFYYAQLKRDIEALTKRTVFKFPDGRIRTMSWLGDWDIMPLTNTVRVCFNPNMDQYLFELRKNYTQYRLQDALVYKSVYSLRLYQVIVSYIDASKINSTELQKEIEFDLDQLKYLLAVQGKYPKWAEFQRNVLRKAVDEINLCNQEFHMEYAAIKTGQKVSGVAFTIRTKGFRKTMDAYKEKCKRLNLYENK